MTLKINLKNVTLHDCLIKFVSQLENYCILFVLFYNEYINNLQNRQYWKEKQILWIKSNLYRICPSQFPFCHSHNSKLCEIIHERLAILSAWPDGRAYGYLFIIRSREKREEKDGSRASMHATRCSIRGGRRHVTYIVMGPPLVSKIGCRATTFQTTRGLFYRRALLFRALQRRKFHALSLTFVNYTTTGTPSDT